MSVIVLLKYTNWIWVVAFKKLNLKSIALKNNLILMPFILYFSSKFSFLASEYPTVYTTPQPAVNPLYQFLNFLNSWSKVELEGEIVNTKGPLVRFLTFPRLLSQDAWIIIMVIVYFSDCVIPLTYLLPVACYCCHY